MTKPHYNASLLTFCYSRPGSRVHHPPARWYVIPWSYYTKQLLTQLQLTRSVIYDSECFCMERTHGMWGGEARDLV